MPTLPDLRHVPDGPQVHGLWLVFWCVFLAERVSQSLEERVLSARNHRGEVCSPDRGYTIEKTNKQTICNPVDVKGGSARFTLFDAVLSEDGSP